jgi:hypothetical protein
MRARTFLEDEVLASDDYYTETQFLVGDTPGTYLYDPAAHLGYDPFLSGTIEADLEQPLVQGQFTFELGAGTKSLSPYVARGVVAGGRPLLDPGRYLLAKARTVGRYPGAPVASLMPWRAIFAGRIDTADPGGDDSTLVLSCRDWFSDWMDLWIEPQESTGVAIIEGGGSDSIFAQLIALFTAGWVGPFGAPLVMGAGSGTLYVPSYTQEPGSGLLALREVALLDGSDLRGRFNSADQWVLTYTTPDRQLIGSQVTFGPGRQLGFRGLAKSRDEVRNRVSVTPADPPRDPQVAEDMASQAKYGKKFLGVAEDAASRIRTPAQAAALATAILLDTKEPKVTAVVDLNFQPLVEINDVFRFMANDVQTDADLVLAVSGYTHNFADDGTVVTTLKTRDLPAAANARWRREAPKMFYSSVYPPSGFAANGARWVQQRTDL